jgi:hypothetical protein
MRTFLTALLIAVAAVELVVVLVLAVVLFLLGSTESIAVGAGMLIVSALAGVLTLRSVRRARSTA